MRVIASAVDDTHRQALSKYNSTHITHAATSPVADKSDFNEELKKTP